MEAANARWVRAVTNATGPESESLDSILAQADGGCIRELAVEIDALPDVRSKIQATRCGIKVVNSSGGRNGNWLASTDPTRRADAVRQAKSDIEATRLAGASVLSVRPGPSRIGSEGPADEYADVLHALQQSLKGLVGCVESSGVALGVAVGCGGLLLSPVEARELVEHFARPEIGAALDLNCVTAYSTPLDWILTLRHRLVCVSLHSECDVDWHELGEALATVQYSGPIVCSGDARQIRTRLGPTLAAGDG